MSIENDYNAAYECMSPMIIDHITGERFPVTLPFRRIPDELEVWIEREKKL